MSSFNKRKVKNRYNLKKKNKGSKVRMSVHISNMNVYVQFINDAESTTVASASSLEKDIKKRSQYANANIAKTIGKLAAERALKAGVKEVVFDRGGSLYHGKVKSLADAAREAGLKF